MSEDEAKKVLEDAGLKKGKVSKGYSDSVAKGNVISSSPIAGASGYYKGDSVDLTVSKGPEKVTVPDVTGRSQDEAKKVLEDAGLKVEVNKRLGGPFGTVRSTDPRRAPASSRTLRSPSTSSDECGPVPLQRTGPRFACSAGGRSASVLSP